MAGLKALIYNNYFETLGGGERSSLDLARALGLLGFEVTLACAQKCAVSGEQLCRAFGLTDAPPWPLLEFESEDALGEHTASTGYDVFVNHTSCSFMPNRAKFGIYMAMFPYESPPAGMPALRSYQVIACNSPFTRNYVSRRWGRDLHVAVAPPPISEIHAQNKAVFERKELLIINIGRFNVFGHNKCQLEAIRAFRSFAEDGTLDESWRLVVAGHVNESPETLEYLEQCRREAHGAPIEVRTNITLEDLRDYYERASAVWQFTGIGLPFGEKPGLCEHLGLVALDGFAYGTAPVAYHRGGMTYFIKHGFNGYTFADQEELGQIMRFMGHSFGTDIHRRLFNYTRESVQYFTFDVFKNRFAKLLENAGVLAK